MSDTESIDLNSAALLDEDTIPNANQSIDCFSCGESMNGVYCYACGNKNDDYRRSIWSLGGELFASLTAFEGRIWRSIRSLIFKPGQMAREFSDGARQKWTSPIRLYLATSLLLFGYIALSQTQLVAFGTKMNGSSIIERGEGERDFSPQVFFLERKSTIEKLVTEDAIKAFEEDLVNIISDADDKPKEALEKELEGANNSYAKAGMAQGRIPLEESVKSLETQIENFENAPPESDALESDNDSVTTENAGSQGGSKIKISDASGDTFNMDAEGFRRAISIGLRQPERINAPIGEWLPRVMFAMMPFSMLLGAIFIRGREKAMLYDHLVHSAYIHAFSFLLLFVFILLVQLTSLPGLLYVYTLILLIYLPLSAKRMFGRGWFKSILTSYGVGVFYTFIMMIILTVLIVMGLSDIAKDVASSVPA
jgi:hypothetical protein